MLCPLVTARVRARSPVRPTVALDVFSDGRAARIRVRFPAGGSLPDELSVYFGAYDGPLGTGVIPGKEICVVDDMLCVADSLSFTIANVDGENTGKIVPGQRIEVDESDPAVAGGQWCRIFTGRTTRVRYSSSASEGSLVSVEAMDLGWHLTTCHARPLLKTDGGKLGQLISNLIEPTWGFASTTATVGNALNRSLKQGRQGVVRAQPRNPLDILPFIQVEPGQTAWDVLETYAKREGFLINVGAKGDVVLFQPDYTQDSPYETIQYHGSKDRSRNTNNLIGSPTLDLSLDGLYSSAECWSTVVVPTPAQQAAIAQNPNAQYTRSVYTPPSSPISFKRRFVVNDGEAINPTMRKNRAVNAFQMGEFNSWSYEVEVNRHSSNGTLFSSDSLCSVNDSVHQVTGAFYVQRVQKTLSERGGTRAKLTLRLPGELDPALLAQVGAGAATVKPQAVKQ